jgi:NTP pyrophosphatase (non-canonical NTP hydrolase)
MSRTLAEMQADSEAVSRHYAEKFDIRRDDDWYLLKLQEESGELVSAFLRLTGRGRLKGEDAATIRSQFDVELADCFAQILLIAEHYGVDLEAAMERKWFVYLESPEHPGTDPHGGKTS